MEIFKHKDLELRSNDDGTYSVVGCDKKAKRVCIPVRVNGKAVSEIDDEAFAGCEGLEELEFEEQSLDDYEPEYMKRIGEYAFCACKRLKSIDIPDSVYSIERGAFSECISLESVVFSKDAFVGSYAFTHCEKLRSIGPISVISEGVLSYCKELETVIMVGVSEICEDAFYHCESLRCIVIPSSVKRIEALAFRGDSSLLSVEFECADNWFSAVSYTDKESALDLGDPKRNAEMLSLMDFDDGVIAWYKK